jgi:phosphoribosylformylglycinamidine synthase
VFNVEISTNPDLEDARGKAVLADIKMMQIKGVKDVHFCPVYFFSGNLTFEQIQTISQRLLTDAVSENYSIAKTDKICADKFNVIEVYYKKGVTDALALSVKKAIKSFDLDDKIIVNTAKRYYLDGQVSFGALENIALKILANSLIQEYRIEKKIL